MGRKSTQVSITDKLSIPCHKPDIESILRVTTTPIIDKTVTMHKKVIFSGHILVCVEYVACVPDGTQPVHFVSFSIPFGGLICHRFLCEKLKACLKAKFLFHECHLIDPRTIKKVIALKVCLRKLFRVRKCLPVPCCEPGHTVACKPDKPLWPVIPQACCTQSPDKSGQDESKLPVSEQKVYHNAQDNDYSQYGDVHLPLVIRPLDSGIESTE
ncbi:MULTISPECIES: DUF3794 domain-containing protein [Sporomusa]|uniref:DUF3794 domain-containing protein n=1 Tax=Sporomusa TaxID=2375 RepID=UPI00166587EA|nr:DUF3794 domain-containing protein [Sporomusa sp. GT1]